MDVSGLFMARCLELAGRGRGNVAPNPVVGAVIVYDGRIIGEGYHRRFGEAHAEVNAIASVRDESLLKKSTLYVNLEPCSHYGKTPPCAELIIRKGIPRVVVACLDPYVKVSGRGISMLHEAGVEVVTGVMENESAELNRFFMTAHKKQRPYIILKWAQSEDKFIDGIREYKSQKPVQLSTPLTRMMVHKLRSEVQAIMVGTNTAILDNPSLNVRYWVGGSPVRVLVDRHMRVPADSRLFDRTQQTLVFTLQSSVESKQSDSEQYMQRHLAVCEHKCENLVQSENVRNVEYIKMNDNKHILMNIIKSLYDKNIHSLLVEGGAMLHRSFIEEGLWDEIIIETAPLKLGNGVCSVGFNDVGIVRMIEKYTVPKFLTTPEKPSVIERYRNGCV